MKASVSVNIATISISIFLLNSQIGVIVNWISCMTLKKAKNNNLHILQVKKNKEVYLFFK